MDDLPAQVVNDVHLEGSARAAAHPRAAVVILLREEHVLAQAVEHAVSTNIYKYLQYLHIDITCWQTPSR